MELIPPTANRIIVVEGENAHAKIVEAERLVAEANMNGKALIVIIPRLWNGKLGKFFSKHLKNHFDLREKLDYMWDTHDKTYHFSDDFRWWQAGKDERAAIDDLALTLSEMGYPVPPDYFKD